MEDARTENKAGKKLLKGVTILAVAGIVCKGLGAIFRIPLTNLIGAEGMSYYGAAYPVYSFFLTLSAAGFPVAISRMVSERTALGDHRNAYRTYKLSFYVMLIIGIISFSCCFFGSGLIATRSGNPGAKLSLMAIAPALLFAPIVSSYRGYYQGRQNMFPTAISEVVEQLIRVGVGLTLSFILAKTSLEYAAAGATFGASAGLMLATLVLVFLFAKNKKNRQKLIGESITRYESDKSIIKEMFKIAIPITIGSTIMPLMMVIDLSIVMNRLQATGWSLAMSKTLYGLISGFCDPLVNMPIVFVDAIAISLLPAVTEAFALNRKAELEENVRAGMKTMMIIAFPCATGLIILARPILYMLYPLRLEEAEMAVSILQILSIGIVTLSVMRTLSSSLQGIGKVNLPVINLFIGALVKIAITYVLVGIPSLNVNGAAIGSVMAYLTAAVLNYIALRKYANIRFKLVDVFLKPLLSSLIMGVATIGVYWIVNRLIDSSSIAALLSIAVSVAVYFVAIFVTGTMSREEALLLPAGSKIVRISDRLHLTSSATPEGKHFKQS